MKPHLVTQTDSRPLVDRRHGLSGPLLVYWFRVLVCLINRQQPALVGDEDRRTCDFLE